MNYLGNRNWGCRFKEIHYNGCRSLIIENDRVHALFLLDKGSDIAEFVHKKTDTDAFWRSPSGLDLLNQPFTGKEPYIGGWFEAFPNAGSPCSYNGTFVQRFGDARFLPWEYSVVEDSPEKLSIKMFMKSNILPLMLEKTVTLRLGEAKLRVDERAVNVSHIPLDFTWGHHPNIARPFLDENCVVEMPDCEFYVHDADGGESGEVKPRKVGEWPYYTENGKTVDTRRIPAFTSEEPEIAMLYARNMKSNRARVHNTKTGLSFALEWDESVFKGMLYARAFVQQKWNSTFGFRYILCLFIMNTYRACLADALAHGEALHLEPGTDMSTWLTFGFEED